MTDTLYYLLFLVPKNWLSQLVGLLVNTKLPFGLEKFIRDFFIKLFHVNVKEAEYELNHYPTLGKFFIRRLRVGARPIHSSSIVSPADGKLTQCGLFDPISPRLTQVKNMTYSLSKLIGPGWNLDRYRHGGYATIYLAPHNYHRFHSPVSGNVSRILHIPGTLWPVNTWSEYNLQGVFVRNERMIVEIETRESSILCVMVGATNVGRITLDFQPLFHSNMNGITKTRQWIPKPLVKLAKGDELGCFEMGSTLILIFDHTEYLNCSSSLKRLMGRTIMMGQGFCE